MRHLRNGFFAGRPKKGSPISDPNAIYIVVTLSLTHKSNFSMLLPRKSKVLSRMKALADQPKEFTDQVRNTLNDIQKATSAAAILCMGTTVNIKRTQISN